MEDSISEHNTRNNISLLGMERKINSLIKENEKYKEIEKDLKNDNDKLKRDFEQLFEKYNKLVIKHEL